METERNRRPTIGQEPLASPYPVSWIDRLANWVDALPGSPWLWYVIAAILIGSLGNAVFWIDGSVPLGEMTSMGTSLGIFSIYWLGLYHYLSRASSRALRAFRPFLEVSDAELEEIDSRLRYLPRSIGWLLVIIAVPLTLATVFSDPSPYGDIVPNGPAPLVGDVLVTSFMMATFLAFLVRSIRQLLMVRALHERATKIDLLNLAPAHAFSGLTARAGIGLSLVVVVGMVVDPMASTAPVNLLLSLVVGLVAVGVFVIPVVGMQDRLEEEKRRELEKVNQSLRAMRARLHAHVQQEEYGQMTQFEAALAALLRERDALGRISTWPWNPRTIRGFASALLLPIVLWLATRVLERFF